MNRNAPETTIDILEYRGDEYVVLPLGFSFTGVVSGGLYVTLANLELASLTEKYSPGLLPDGIPYDKIPLLYTHCFFFHFVPRDEFVRVARIAYSKYAY